jgi:ribonucleotide reductase alpha subunit
VKDGGKVHLRFPVQKDAKHTVEDWVDAKQLWHEIIEAAWASAEPGLLFWDTVKKRTPTECYDGYKSVSTNPCLAYDTQIAVADGRGYVSIGDLATAGLDVPVYAHDNDTGRIVVKTMRNPRLTGESMPIYKVTIEGGHTFKATGNHTMILRDGTRKTVQDLQPGDQLTISKRVERTLVEMGSTTRTNNPNHYVMVENSISSRSEHRLIWEFHNGAVPPGHVIHHVNFNSKDNHLENLKCMEFRAHQELHASMMKGDNNPIFKIKADPSRFAEYSAKMSQSTGGLNNPRAYDLSNEELMKHIEVLADSLGRRPSGGDWENYATQNSLPKFLNSFRLGGKKFSQIVAEICDKLGITSELTSADPRTATRALEAQESGYSWRISDNDLQVEKKCEWCETNFWSTYDRREISFCGHSCSNYYANRKAGKNAARAAYLQKMHEERGTKNRVEQLNVYTKLRFDLGRDPLHDEWAEACKSNDLPARLGTKNGFTSWKQLKSEASLHNHRVVSVEFAGHEDVYNGTVDDTHNFFFGGWKEENNEQIQVLSENCGEIVLSPYDSCRLLLVNVYKFVKNPFTSAAAFDQQGYNTAIQKAQRLMDDLIDLELEAVDKIIAKIQNDPEPADVKRGELELWNKIRTAAINGRRTGLGITALGDTLAAMNFVYGSDVSIQMTETVYRTLAVNAYKSSVQMAAERGAFPVFDLKAEQDHPFIQQVMSQDEDLAAAYTKYGRRNIALTTTAPAGSVSVLTQTTSGIEPAFMLFYKRRKKVNGDDPSVRVDFVDQLGDKWQEYMVYHHAFKKWMDVNHKTEAQANESPYAGGTANEIDWVKKVDLQAAAQKWICHSISNTTNIPNSTTVDVVKDIYMRGWETGCKGVTVYRDGCRSGVLVADTPKKEEPKVDGQPKTITENHAPKRPKELPCDIHRINVRGHDGSESYLVLVGKMDGQPYEVFCGLSQHVEVPKKSKAGTLLKNGKKDGVATYNLSIPVGDDDHLLFKNVVELFDNPNHGAVTRTISLALRHGVPVSYVCEQLQKDKNSDMYSFSRALARVLKSYIPDGTKSASDKTCASCGVEDGLVYQEGCLTCKNCGNSKCG